MAILHLRGIITSEGKLEVDLPGGVTPGEVEVTIQAAQTPREEAIWTPEEIKAVMEQIQSAKPKTGAEIAASLTTSEGWDHIADGAEWIKEQRRKQREQSQW
jgi:hypothetical protein